MAGRARPCYVFIFDSQRRNGEEKPVGGVRLWMSAGKKVKVVTCPPALLIFASSYLGMNHVVNAFSVAGGSCWPAGTGTGPWVLIPSESLFFCFFVSQILTSHT